MSHRNTTTTTSYSYQSALPSPFGLTSDLTSDDIILLRREPVAESRIRLVSQKASSQRPSRYTRTPPSSSSGLGSPAAAEIDVIRYTSTAGAPGIGSRSNGIGRLTPEAGRRNEYTFHDIPVDVQSRSRSPASSDVRNSTTRKITTLTTSTTSGDGLNGWSDQRSSLRSSPHTVDVPDDIRRRSSATIAVDRSSPKRDANSPSSGYDLRSSPAFLSPSPKRSLTPSGLETTSNGNSNGVGETRGVGKLTVFDGQEPSRQRVSPTRDIVDQREFFARIQRELDDQRASWKPEIDKLTRSAAAVDLNDDDVRGGNRRGVNREARGFASSLSSGRRNAPDAGSTVLDDDDFGPHAAAVFDAETSSYVDTSGPQAIFKAFVDVSEFNPNEIDVHVDPLTSRVVVEASADLLPGVGGGPAQCRTFTQRIQLPRFADEQSMVARMNRQGILKIEVPLIFYNPPPAERYHEYDSKAKAFVYEVRDDPSDPSRQLMEILVNTGVDATARDLRVEIEGDRLAIYADPTASGDGRDPKKRRLIKSFTLPPSTDVGGITSRLGRDGRLTVLIPIIKKGR